MGNPLLKIVELRLEAQFRRCRVPRLPKDSVVWVYIYFNIIKLLPESALKDPPHIALKDFSNIETCVWFVGIAHRIRKTMRQ